MGEYGFIATLFGSGVAFLFGWFASKIYYEKKAKKGLLV